MEESVERETLTGLTLSKRNLMSRKPSLESGLMCVLFSRMSQLGWK